MKSKTAKRRPKRVLVKLHWHHRKTASAIRKLDADERRDYEAELKKANVFTERVYQYSPINPSERWTDADINKALLWARKLALRAAKTVHGVQELSIFDDWNGVKLRRWFRTDGEDGIPPGAQWEMTENPGGGFAVRFYLVSLRVAGFVEWFEQYEQRPDIDVERIRPGSTKIRKDITTYGVKTSVLEQHPKRPAQLRELYKAVSPLKESDLELLVSIAQSLDNRKEPNGQKAATR